MKQLTKIMTVVGGVVLLSACAGQSVSTQASSNTPAKPIATSDSANANVNEPDSGDAAHAWATNKGWQLVWNDEFNQDDVDTSKWSWEENCWGGSNNELQCYTDRKKNSFLEDGKLIIRAHKETFVGPAEPLEANPNAGSKTLPYTSARLRSLGKGDWQYGRFEVRAKLPAGQGMWPAIWMLPSEWRYGIWAASGEIDIVEAVSMKADEPNKTVYGTIHYGGQWPNNVFSGVPYKFADSDPSKDFHTYAIEWADGEIRWYIDDEHYATQRQSGWYTQIKNDEGDLYNVEGSAPFDQPFHVLLNLAVGGNWPGSPDASTQFPAQMEFEYVRVYKCPNATSSLRTCATKDRRNAERNFGKQPPKINNIKFDPDFIKADQVDIYTDESVIPFVIDEYVAEGSIDVKEVDEKDRGKVAQIAFNTNESVVFWQGPIGFDFTGFNYLEFDLMRLVDDRSTDAIMIKVDCIYPCGTGDYPIKPAPVGEWKSFRIPLKDLKSHPGSTLNLATVDTPLVIFPIWGNQKGVVLRLDNIRMVR